MLLNSQSPIPLYRQLAQRILADIDAGKYAVAARIPSENVLAVDFAIGRPTVRQATDLLVRQGRLERRRGSGTYVLPPPQTIDLFSLAGTSAALGKSDLHSSLELVSGPCRVSPLAASRSTDAVADRQSFPVDSVDRIKIERRATVDSIPVLFETLWFSVDAFPGLEKYSLRNQSLAALVRDVYFMEPTAAEQSFTVMHADQFYAEELNCQRGTPLLRVLRNLHFGELENALHAEIVCLTERFAFSQTLYPAQLDAQQTREASTQAGAREQTTHAMDN